MPSSSPSPRLWVVRSMVPSVEEDAKPGQMVEMVQVVSGAELVDVAVRMAKKTQGYDEDVRSIHELGTVVDHAEDSGYTVYPAEAGV